MDKTKMLENGYPAPFVDQETRESEAYGLAWAQYISGYWFTGGYGARDNWKFTQQRQEILRLRDYMRGTVDPRQFDDILNIDADVSSKSYDRQVLDVAPRYFNMVIDGISDSLFGIRFKGTDAYSMEMIAKWRDEVMKEMMFAKYAPKFNKATGVDIPVQDGLPEDEKELDQLEKLDFNTNYEIAAEECVNRVFELNNYDEIANLCIEDLVVHGSCVAKPEYDNQLGVRIKYVDPANYIHSVNTDMTRDMRGVFYGGEVRQINSTELERTIRRKLTQEEKEEIMKTQQINQEVLRGDSEFLIEILDFAYKATKEKVYKKRYNGRGGYKLTKKDSNWNPPEDRKHIKLSEQYDTWYGGIYIIGSNKLYNYGEMKFMSRSRGGIKRVFSPYAHYKLSTTSMGRRLEDIIKQLHVTHMKIQHLVTSLVPSAYDINISALQEVNIGGAKGTLEPHELIDIKNNTGVGIYAGETIDGMGSNNPFTPSGLNQLGDLNALITTYNHWVSEANRVTGINEYTSGNANLKGVLSSVSGAAIEASNTATKHIFNAWFSWARALADITINRVQDCFLYGNTKAIMSALIGKMDIQLLQTGYFAHEAQFVPILDIKPSVQERIEFKQRLNESIKVGAITTVEAAEIELNIDNPRRAVQVMKTLQKKREKAKREADMQMSQAESQGKMQAIQMDRQMELQVIQAKTQGELEVKKQEGLIESQRLGLEAKIKFEYQTREHAHDEKMVRAKVDTEKYKEDRKDIRQSKGNTELSKENARKVTQPDQAIDFEAEEKFKKQYE